jgi:DNA-binding CsgD family transcriptional regulator
MQADSRHLDPLIEQIYGAIGRPEVWSVVLGAITEMMRGNRALLWIHDAQANRLLFAAPYNVPADKIALFEREHLSNPTELAMLQLMVGQTVQSSRPVIDHAQVEKMAVYRDIMAPLGIYYGSGGIVLRDGSVAGILLIYRSREAGPFAEEEDEIVVRLIPHLCRAAQLHYRLLATELERAAAASALDRLTHAVVICDGEARILLTNAPAKALFDKKRGMRSIAGHLGGSTAAQSNELVDAIRAVGSRQRDTASVTLENDDEIFRVLISRVSPQLRLNLPEQPDLVLISFSDPAADLTAGTKVLGEMLQLTDAESRVALGLARGKTLDTITGESRVSINTIKTHLASAFAKTGTSRQPDLVRLVLRTIGPFGLE